MKMIIIVQRNLPGVSNMADQGRIILQNYCVCNLSIIMLYKGLKGAASIPTNDLVTPPPPPNQACQKASLFGISNALY